MKNLILILLCLLSCEVEQFEVEPQLELMGYEIINSTTLYAHIYYKATPGYRIFWTSPDTVLIDEIKTCIVCCSTYSNKFGEGQQLVILPYNYNSRIWTVIGYINDIIIDTIEIDEK